MQIADQAGTSFTDATASPDTSYSYTVVAVDAAGNVSPASAAATVSTTGAPDGTPPSQPGNLTATAASSSQVNLTWTASTDNVGVTGYHVYRNGTQLQTPTPPDATPPTAYTDDTAQPGTAYTYQVSAVDAAGNESTKASATVSTPSAGGTLTFAPTDDATVDSSQPTVNFGTNSRLTVDNSPVNYSLLKFTVAGTGGCPITAAKLQLTVGNGTDDKSPYGGDVYGDHHQHLDPIHRDLEHRPGCRGHQGRQRADRGEPEHELPVRRQTTGHRRRHGQHADQEHQRRRRQVLLQGRRNHQSGSPTPSHLRVRPRRTGRRRRSRPTSRRRHRAAVW